MKTSGNSSAPSQTRLSASQPGDTRSRKRFSLTGRSRDYDPAITAARPDIADVRLANTIFAPHYAAPMPRVVLIDTSLTDRRDGDEVAQLAAGETFEVLEVTAAHAWGVVQASGRVGYIALSALAAA